MLFRSKRVRSGSADRQVVRAQILQSAPRLRIDGFGIVLNDGQRRPYGGNSSDEVPRPVIRFGARRQSSFSSLEFLLDGSMSATKK